MRIYCKRHGTHLDPQPSGYYPTQVWHCPAEVRERLTAQQLLAVGIHPQNPAIAAVIVTGRGDTTRLIALPHPQHLRGGPP